MSAGARLWWLFGASVLTALLLTEIPLPPWAQGLRPSWVAVVIIYWVLYEPRRFGLLSAWIAGILLDTLRGAWLGQHALALTLMAFVVLSFHLRIRVFPLGQQMATVFMLVALYEFALFWIDGISGRAVEDWRRWLTVLSSAAFWPAIAGILDTLRDRATARGR